MKKNVKKFIFIIIILNCLLMFNNSYGVTYKKELSIDIAYKEWTMITRYIVASQNATIRILSPGWYNLTSEQIKELDKNNNGKIDNNDLDNLKDLFNRGGNKKLLLKSDDDRLIYINNYLSDKFLLCFTKNKKLIIADINTEPSVNSSPSIFIQLNFKFRRLWFQSLTLCRLFLNSL